MTGPLVVQPKAKTPDKTRIYLYVLHEAGSILTLKQAALANGVSEDLFDRVVNPLAMTRGGSADLSSGPGKA